MIYKYCILLLVGIVGVARAQTPSPAPSPSPSPLPTNTKAPTVNCVAGQYSDTGSSTAAIPCTPCAGGKFQPYDGFTDCFGCTPGNYCPAGSVDPQPCPAGYYCLSSSSTATACFVGTYSAAAESSACTDCSSGKYSASTASTSCSACAVDTYSAGQASTCTSCSQGRYSYAAASSCLSYPTPMPTTTTPRPTVTYRPTSRPVLRPTSVPTVGPSLNPTPWPTLVPSPAPSQPPSSSPTSAPLSSPTQQPTSQPIPVPTSVPTPMPTFEPTVYPTGQPTVTPVSAPTPAPRPQPTSVPVPGPTQQPTSVPISSPTQQPTLLPTPLPTLLPTLFPTREPTSVPSPLPTLTPSQLPTSVPILRPTPQPTPIPTPSPSPLPTTPPTPSPTIIPTPSPTSLPTPLPTPVPIPQPTPMPSPVPSPPPTGLPTPTPTHIPTALGTLSLATSMDLTLDTSESPTDDMRTTIEEQIALAMGLSVDNIFNLITVVRTVDSLPHTKKATRRLASSLWSVFYTIITARSDQYADISSLSSGVSSTMSSSSFAASLGTALTYDVTVDNVEVVLNSAPDPSVSPTHTPTPLPTRFPTAKEATSSEDSAVVLYAGLGAVAVAVLVMAYIGYFHFYRPKLAANKRWKEKDDVIEGLERSMKKKGKKIRVTRNLLNEGGDMEEDLGELELGVMQTARPTPAQTEWTSPNLSVQVVFKKELRIFMGQDEAFTARGEGMEFAGKCRNKLVTARQLPSRVRQLSETRNHFEKEVEALMVLSHVNLQWYFGVCEHKDHLCVVFEACGTDTLAKLGPSFTTEEYYRVGSELLAGMAYLHGKQMSHKNLKTEHIFVDAKTDSVKICEFGFVGSEVSDIQPSVYMSLERFEGRCTDYMKDDVYAVAMILCELWTRAKPFPYWDTKTLMAKVAKGTRPELKRKTSKGQSLSPPSSLAQLISECWASDPDARPCVSDAATVFLHGQLSLLDQDTASPPIQDSAAAGSSGGGRGGGGRNGVSSGSSGGGGGKGEMLIARVNKVVHRKPMTGGAAEEEEVGQVNVLQFLDSSKGHAYL